MHGCGIGSAGREQYRTPLQIAIKILTNRKEPTLTSDTLMLLAPAELTIIRIIKTTRSDM